MSRLLLVLYEDHEYGYQEDVFKHERAVLLYESLIVYDHSTSRYCRGPATEPRLYAADSGNLYTTGNRYGYYAARGY